jgi:hypothetical protein
VWKFPRNIYYRETFGSPFDFFTSKNYQCRELISEAIYRSIYLSLWLFLEQQYLNQKNESITYFCYRGNLFLQCKEKKCMKYEGSWILFDWAIKLHVLKSNRLSDNILGKCNRTFFNWYFCISIKQNMMNWPLKFMMKWDRIIIKEISYLKYYCAVI